MNNTYPCANKCSEFKEGGQCFYCLIQQIEKREFELGAALEDAYVKCGPSQVIDCTGISSKKVELRFKAGGVVVTASPEFKGGDWVVLANSVSRESSLAQILKTDGRWSIIKWLDDNTESNVRLDFLRHATDEEIAAGRRLDHIVEPNDMGDDTHISPLCVSKSSENENQGDLSLKENKGAFERFYKAKYMQGMSEIQIKNHHDLFRFNDYANEYWHNIVNRQWHAWNARQPEISAMQAKVDELQAENKMLHEAAATHLRNQNHYMDLYHRLVEQLYPYALDLNEPIDGYPKEYVDGYNRAREIAHYNLLEMMESDVEYICAQCGMLGGGGEA